MEMSANMDNVKEFIENEEFHQFLLSHTTNFGTAAWVLQTLLDAYEEAEEKLAAAGSEEEEGLDESADEQN